MMSPQDVIRKWWLQTARLGMTPSEAADTLMAAISGAGFEITPRKKGRESVAGVKRRDLQERQFNLLSCHQIVGMPALPTWDHPAFLRP